MIMKKKVLALSVAAALGGVAAGSVVAAPAIQEAGVGHALILPYFTTQAGYSTLLSITNTDTVNGKAVKVRFRGAVDSDDIMDFQVFLSPNDVWTANISQDVASGLSKLSTTDKSCTLPVSNIVNGTFLTGRLLAYTDAGAVVHSVAEQTREGYAEIFNMADVTPKLLDGVTANPLFTAIKHVNGVAPCTSATLLGIEAVGGEVVAPAVANGNGAEVVGAAAYTAFQQVFPPTTGLMGNWVIIDVPNTRTFSGGMPAIQTAVQTMVVYSGQTGAAGARTPVNTFANRATNTFPALKLTADGVLLGSATTGVIPADYDFPDMSTPYEAVVGSGLFTPTAYVAALSGAILRKSVMNEFFTDTNFGGATDWVLSMPTRRYHVAGRGTNYATAASALGTGLGFGGAATGPFLGVTTFATNGRSAAVGTGSSAAFWDREETAATGSGAVLSPGTPTLYSLAGEVNVLSWNNTGATSSVLGASVILANSSTGAVNTGWASQATPGAGAGLPFLGSAFIKAANGQAQAGVSGNYGISYPHRYK